jgi:hypothetical protein
MFPALLIPNEFAIGPPDVFPTIAPFPFTQAVTVQFPFPGVILLSKTILSFEPSNSQVPPLGLLNATPFSNEPEIEPAKL